MRTSLDIEAGERCFLADLDRCSGPVRESICERHSWALFQMAWR